MTRNNKILIAVLLSATIIGMLLVVFLPGLSLKKSSLVATLSSRYSAVKVADPKDETLGTISHVTLFLNIKNNTNSTITGAKAHFEFPNTNNYGLITQDDIVLDEKTTRQNKKYKVYFVPAIKPGGSTQMEVYFVSFKPGKANVKATVITNSGQVANTNMISIDVQ